MPLRRNPEHHACLRIHLKEIYLSEFPDIRGNDIPFRGPYSKGYWGLHAVPPYSWKLQCIPQTDLRPEGAADRESKSWPTLPQEEKRIRFTEIEGILYPQKV